MLHLIHFIQIIFIFTCNQYTNTNELFHTFNTQSPHSDTNFSSTATCCARLEFSPCPAPAFALTHPGWLQRLPRPEVTCVSQSLPTWLSASRDPKSWLPGRGNPAGPGRHTAHRASLPVSWEERRRKDPTFLSPQEGRCGGNRPQNPGPFYWGVSLPVIFNGARCWATSQEPGEMRDALPVVFTQEETEARRDELPRPCSQIPLPFYPSRSSLLPSHRVCAYVCMRVCVHINVCVCVCAWWSAT